MLKENKMEFLEKALNSYALKDKIYNKIKGDVMIFTGMLVVVAIIGIIYNMLKNKLLDFLHYVSKNFNKNKIYYKI